MMVEKNENNVQIELHVLTLQERLWLQTDVIYWCYDKVKIWREL